MTKKLVHNVETGEVFEIELTIQEIAQLKADQEEKTAEIKEAEAKKITKTALLERLGMTAEEAALLLA